MKTCSFRVALTLAVLCAGAAATIAQESVPSRLGSVYVAGGAFMAADQPIFRGDLAKLAPGSPLLAHDLADHQFMNERYHTGTPVFDVSIGILPFRTAERMGPELRLGLTYAGAMSNGAWLERTVRTPYDTLTSSQTGQQIFVDSVERSTYWIDHSAERLGINASLIWRTQGRWSLFGGVGVVGGVVMNSRTDVSKTVWTGVEGPMTNWYSAYGVPAAFGRNSPLESYRNGTGWWCAGQIPFGIDLQIARNNAFWNKMHLFYELRPQLLLQHLPELGTYSAFSLQSLIGVRLKL
jgi:opacity protein-like surface antigen